MAIRTPLRRRPLVWTLIAAGVVFAVAGLALFQPWKLVVDVRVEEAAPVAAPAAPVEPAAPTEPVILGRARFAVSFAAADLEPVAA